MGGGIRVFSKILPLLSTNSGGGARVVPPKRLHAPLVYTTLFCATSPEEKGRFLSLCLVNFLLLTPSIHHLPTLRAPNGPPFLSSPPPPAFNPTHPSSGTPPPSPTAAPGLPSCHPIAPPPSTPGSGFKSHVTAFVVHPPPLGRCPVCHPSHVCPGGRHSNSTPLPPSCAQKKTRSEKRKRKREHPPGRLGREGAKRGVEGLYKKKGKITFPKYNSLV